MRKWKKRVLAALGALLLLFIATVVVALIYIDVIAKKGIEYGTAAALKVDTKLEAVTLHLFGGQLDARTMTIANPPDYTTDHLMKFDSMDVAVETGSLFSDTIVVDHIRIEGLDINIEQKLGRNNVSDVLNNISEGAEEEKKPEEEKPGRKLRVNLVLVTNTTVHVQTLPVGGEISTLHVNIPEIRMENVNPEESKGMMVGELVRRLFPAIIASVLDKGRGVIPEGLARDMADKVGGTVKALGAGASKLVTQVGGGAVELIGRSAGGLLDATGRGAEAVRDAADKAKEGTGGLLENILGKKKESPPDEKKDEGKP